MVTRLREERGPERTSAAARPAIEGGVVRDHQGAATRAAANAAPGVRGSWTWTTSASTTACGRHPRDWRGDGRQLRDRAVEPELPWVARAG